MSENLQPIKIKKFGWIRGLPNLYDPVYMLPLRLTILPTTIDLRPKCPQVYDQKELGSCTANAVGALFQFLLMKQGCHSWVPSRLFIYYNSRVLEGTESIDTGATLNSSIKVATQLGMPHESEWWYDVNKFNVKPNKKIYNDAIDNKIMQFHTIDNTNLATMRTCLATGCPIAIGFAAYESFESEEVKRTGIVPMPKRGEQIIGGHAVLIVGYDDINNCFIVRNSYGDNWGLMGYFLMPYQYFTNIGLAADAWTASLVSC